MADSKCGTIPSPPMAPSKPDIAGLPWLGVEAVAEVMHDSRGPEWLDRTPGEIFGSLARHAFAILIYGYDALDQDGKKHLAKVACRALMLLHLTSDKRVPRVSDRNDVGRMP